MSEDGVTTKFLRLFFSNVFAAHYGVLKIEMCITLVVFNSDWRNPLMAKSHSEIRFFYISYFYILFLLIKYCLE